MDLINYIPEAAQQNIWVLSILSTLPIPFILIGAYCFDSIERESLWLILLLFIGGIGSAHITGRIYGIIYEHFGYSTSVSPNTMAEMLFRNFIVVGFTEEISKFLVLWLITWKNKEFDYRFDAILYAIVVGLGFSFDEDMIYASMYGIETAVGRALTCFSGHPAFGIYVGLFYAMSKECMNEGRKKTAIFFGAAAIVVPAFFHGLWDFMCNLEETGGYDRLDDICRGFCLLYIMCALYILYYISSEDRRI